MKTLLKIVTLLMPWFLRRRMLNQFFGFEIHPTAHIGFSWIYPKKLKMGPGSKIDLFNVAIHLDHIEMEDGAFIGRNNWITGFESGTGSKHFNHQPNRVSRLFMGQQSSVTKHHHIDCTNSIEIGRFATVAGYGTQLLTHSIDVYENRQDSKPIIIGNYAFIGTSSVILGGAVIPDFCLLSAKSLLNKAFTERWKIYGGVPAKLLCEIPKDAGYFSRESGFVY